MTFEQMAKQRYSVRAFEKTPVEKEKLEAIVKVANSAPTATNAQPFHIWAVMTEEGMARINKATPYGFGAPAALVLGVKPEQAWTRADDGHNFADVDGGIVGAHILLSVCEQGLGTTWVGRIDPAVLISEFPEMEGYEIVGIFPIGYPAGQPGHNHEKRKPLEEMVDFI